MPLYKIFSLDEAEEAPPFLGGLTSVSYSDFTWAAHQSFMETGVHGVTADGVIAKLNALKNRDDKPGVGSWVNMGDGTPRWVAESALRYRRTGLRRTCRAEPRDARFSFAFIFCTLRLVYHT